jgi:hypothetical protein
MDIANRMYGSNGLQKHDCIIAGDVALLQYRAVAWRAVYLLLPLS